MRIISTTTTVGGVVIDLRRGDTTLTLSLVNGPVTLTKRDAIFLAKMIISDAEKLEG